METFGDTPKTDKEKIWAVSGTGDDFQCIHVAESQEMECLLREAAEVIRCYSNSDMMGTSGDDMIEKIEKYLAI